PKERQEEAAKKHPEAAQRLKEQDNQKQHAQQGQTTRDDEVAEQIKSLTQTVAALAQAVQTMKATQEQEWHDMTNKKRGEGQ
ncbi:MAG: hypothetical protein ACRD2L_12385, partial [Terriglobia bacterium]